MATRLVNGGRIKDGNFESYNKETKSYDSLGNDSNGENLGKVKSSDFGKPTVGGGVNYSGSNTAVQGITTSDNAASVLKTARETLDGIQGNLNSSVASGEVSSGAGDKPAVPVDESNPFTGLFERINALQTNLNTAKEAERAAKEAQASQETQAKLNSITSAEEVGKSGQADLTAGVTAIGNAERGRPTNTANIQDPIIQALADKSIANVGILNQQMQALSQYRAQFNEYTQQDIDSIARTAERSVTRQMDENERTKRAMEFAGIVGGRAQFSPLVEQSIIHEVVQEGLDKIEVINEKKNSAIREARKAEADFNIDAFEKQANLAKEYNNEIESTISAMNTQVRQAEKDERDKIDYRQQQEERSSLILAGELINSTPEQIAQAAVANGIDYALLSKAVNDAKFEQSTRDFTAKDQVLSLEERRASINASNRANQPKVEADFSKRESALLSEAGLDGASYSEKVAFLNLTPTDQNDTIKNYKDEESDVESKTVSEVIADAVGPNTWFSNKGTDDKVKEVAASFNINPKGWRNGEEAKNFLGTIVQNLKTSYPDISDADIKDYLTQIPKDATVTELKAYLQFAREGVK